MGRITLLLASRQLLRVNSPAKDRDMQVIYESLYTHRISESAVGG